MRIESLYQFLVPLAFMAIWALTSLFNRDTQPLPPRVGRPLNPDGPPPPRSNEWRPEPQLRETNTTRPSPSAPYRGAERPDDGIVILEEQNRRPAIPVGRISSASPRRVNRRPPAPPAPRRVEPVATPRTLAASMTREVNPPSIQSQALNPLVLPPSPLLTTPNDEAAKAQAGRALVRNLDAFSSADIRLIVQTPNRLREGLIIGELLKPPVALRPGHLSHPGRSPRTG